ncbi:hypothetical protein [Ectobacillus panaciterrae]|uniref:hypothetical protein n=1 Tax=Ectobacillus panaciterrae TaxID=363872 RepID=UPI0004127B27|nr:hypothetical protein [Ectobacillus panaciterrae]
MQLTKERQNELHYHIPSQSFILSDDTLMGTMDVTREDYQPGEIRSRTIDPLLA